MSWDVYFGRQHLGLAQDNESQDAQITAAMAVALAAAESYCDRKFLMQEDTEDFVGPLGPVLTVRRWPLIELLSLLPLSPLGPNPPEPSPIPSTWRFDWRRGVVYMGAGSWTITPVGDAPGPLIDGARGFQLTYQGGFDPSNMPPDLEAALWMAFDAVWATTPGYGLPVGSSSSGAPVRSFSIDGMSVTYDNSASGEGGRGAAPGAWGLLPANALGILTFYRAESAALGA